ncbi:hypothetical protein K438DRAFT_1996975 [Mycena galopus ATCC 62051]|nr:hypothetical protein K438DRAFT_1996975 [Mycena galopus ATCC 62051]
MLYRFREEQESELGFGTRGGKQPRMASEGGDGHVQLQEEAEQKEDAVGSSDDLEMLNSCRSHIIIAGLYSVVYPVFVATRFQSLHQSLRLAQNELQHTVNSGTCALSLLPAVGDEIF